MQVQQLKIAQLMANKAYMVLSLLLLSLTGQAGAASLSDELLKVSANSNEQIPAANIVISPRVSLTVSPKKCVAMQQGQNCYLEVKINFQANNIGNYCLHLTGQTIALQCWQGSKQGKYEYAFESKTDLEFVITKQKLNAQESKQKLNEKLATAQVKMAWVHEKKGKPRMSWRLF